MSAPFLCFFASFLLSFIASWILQQSHERDLLGGPNLEVAASAPGRGQHRIEQYNLHRISSRWSFPEQRFPEWGLVELQVLNLEELRD